jgi:hypothetical protein
MNLAYEFVRIIVLPSRKIFEADKSKHKDIVPRTNLKIM